MGIEMRSEGRALVRGRMTSKDLQVIERAVRYAEAREHRPFRKAIMEIYGYTPDDPYLASKVSRIKRKLEGRLRDSEVFDIHRIDKFRIAAKLDQLLDAKQKVVRNGKVVTEIEDNRTQLDALKIAANILGLSQRKGGIDIGKQVNNIIVQMESVEDARKRVKAAVSENEYIEKNYTVEEAPGSGDQTFR